jgi:hypothetical protein
LVAVTLQFQLVCAQGSVAVTCACHGIRLINFLPFELM